MSQQTETLYPHEQIIKILDDHFPVSVLVISLIMLLIISVIVLWVLHLQSVVLSTTLTQNPACDLMRCVSCCK